VSIVTQDATTTSLKEKRGAHRFGEYIRSQKVNRIAVDQEERERERGRERERERERER
jgi:hypothetical protein